MHDLFFLNTIKTKKRPAVINFFTGNSGKALVLRSWLASCSPTE
jgi:hypothetical protein